MAQEDRLRALEDEVGVLKDQIRHTLLEIQEQVLIHYYPDLRAQAAAPPDVALPSLRRGGAGQSGRSLSGVQRVSVQGQEGAASPDGPDPSAGDGLHLPLGAEAQAAPLEAGEGGKWATVTALLSWASNSVERIGRERTTKAIEICARGGYLDAQVKETLLQLIALSDDERRVEQVSVRIVRDVLAELNEALGQAPDAAAANWLLEEVSIG